MLNSKTNLRNYRVGQILKRNFREGSNFNLLSSIKIIFNRLTTETEGWISGFIEDNDEAPALKYTSQIISKCW